MQLRKVLAHKESRVTELRQRLIARQREKGIHSMSAEHSVDRSTTYQSIVVHQTPIDADANSNCITGT